MTKKSIFLETTIQAEKIFGEKPKRAKIQKNLKGKRVCTSTFVLNEFQKTFLDSVIQFYNLLIDSPDPHTALRRATKFWRGRITHRIIQIFATLCDEENNSKEAALERLETWIEDGLLIEFLKNIEEPLINKTSCQRVAGGPFKVGKLYDIKISCSKAKPPDCNIENFWEDHKDELKSLSSSTLLAKSTDEELNKICDTAKAIKDKSDSPYGNNCTVYLSDALIAIESPKGGQIYSTNKKHFKPICKVIKDRKVYKEV